MKLILHAGPPKTGTTALQGALFAAREELFQQGVLYPTAGNKKINHGYLSSIFLPHEVAPRLLKAWPQSEYERLGKDFSDKIQRQIQERAPEVLILSWEWFVAAHEQVPGRQLRAFLEGLDPSSIEVLLYVRRPSDHFLSAAQQGLRASSQFAPIFQTPMTRVIDGFKATMAGYKITPRTFDRSLLVDGNIVTDFARHYLPDEGRFMDPVQTFAQANRSFSPEAMVVLQDFRRTLQSDLDGVANKKTNSLMRRLQWFDAANEAPRPRLRDEWSEFLDYGNDEALILRDKHGVIFPDFDYGRLEQGKFAPEPPQSGNVSDYVHVQSERLSCLINKIESLFWMPNRDGARWIKGLKERYGVKSIGWRPLWRYLA